MKTGQALQSLINIVHNNYSKRWQFEVNLKKCATVIFSKTEEVLAGGFGVMKAFPF